MRIYDKTNSAQERMMKRCSELNHIFIGTYYSVVYNIPQRLHSKRSQGLRGIYAKCTALQRVVRYRITFRNIRKANVHKAYAEFMPDAQGFYPVALSSK